MCQAKPLTDDVKLENPQPVKISWVDEGIPDKDTGFTFTYKPDPVIDNARPDVTITRYVTESSGSKIGKISRGGGGVNSRRSYVS